MKKWWGGVEGRGVEARAGVGDRAAGWELGAGRAVMRVVRLGGLNRVAQELGRVNGAREGVVTQQLRTRTRGDGGGGAGGDGCGDSGCAQGAAAAFAAGRAERAHAHAAPLHAAGARGTCGPRRARRVRTTAGFSFEGGTHLAVWRAEAAEEQRHAASSHRIDQCAACALGVALQRGRRVGEAVLQPQSVSVSASALSPQSMPKPST